MFVNLFKTKQPPNFLCVHCSRCRLSSWWPSPIVYYLEPIGHKCTKSIAFDASVHCYKSVTGQDLYSDLYCWHLLTLQTAMVHGFELYDSKTPTRSPLFQSCTQCLTKIGWEEITENFKNTQERAKSSNFSVNVMRKW